MWRIFLACGHTVPRCKRGSHVQRGFSRHHLTSENFMPVFKKILVPVDGSATSNKAVDFALRMAQDDQASVRLRHCIDETSFLDAYE